MSPLKKHASLLLTAGIVLMAIGLGLFVIVPLVAWAPLTAGVVLVVASSSAWARDSGSGRTRRHSHGQRQGR